MPNSIYFLFLSLTLTTPAMGNFDNYKEFDVYVCNLNETVAKRNNEPTPVESLNFHNRLLNAVENVMVNNSFKASIKIECEYDSNLEAPILFVAHGYINYSDGDVFDVRVSTGPTHQIDGLPVNLIVDGETHSTELRLGRGVYAETAFINPPEIHESSSELASLGSNSASKAALFDKKLALAGAVLSGRSAWSVADVNLNELLRVYEDNVDQPFSNDTLVRYTEFLTYKSFEYLSQKNRGLDVDLTAFQQMNESNPFSPTPIHILLYEQTLTQSELTFEEFREIVEKSKLPEIGFKLSSPFENLVLDLAGFER